ncbi:NADH dehydrogenase 1 beta subcomplex subunit 8 ndufb8 [Desmophyllum pertusum]|uniref:NADH dehydrogenase 1 beta subcomplex subunit 8 ndufb8 n=1 Tax=Desmophyllum pertusum TaxID=174260 RepID=A0A9X0A638_9CNID|nr:NADH dehydrogenase 1 beta subcomplex subunit 8 ndufb8 [Desmophyllum pertusum]
MFGVFKMAAKGGLRLGQALLRRAVLRPQVLLGIRKAHDDHKRFPIPTPENDWKTFKRDWDDDGYALGDYPNLPDISYQRRQHVGWWDWQERRNFNEPVHPDEDAMNVWVWTEVDCNDRYTPHEALMHLAIAASIVAFIGYLSYLYDKLDRDPAIPRQYPFNNLYLERGGDPNKDPSEEVLDPKKRVIPNNVYGS